MTFSEKKCGPSLSLSHLKFITARSRKQFSRRRKKSLKKEPKRNFERLIAAIWRKREIQNKIGIAVMLTGDPQCCCFQLSQIPSHHHYHKSREEIIENSD
jgi:hypothetical protein